MSPNQPPPEIPRAPGAQGDEARQLVERKTAEADQRRAVVSISARGLKLIEAVAPTSEAIYAEITRRFGARRLSELQEMLAVLEHSLADTEGADRDDGEE